MVDFNIPSPPQVPEDPDEFTKKYPFTGGDAPGQILHIKLNFFSYGTDDKAHAASIILSFISASLLVLLFIIGCFVDPKWIGDAIKLIASIFTFTSGVAIGKGSKGNS